jgi:uncharacterized cofD-like protein
MSTLLRGLKDYTSRITAVVSVADDGGSSGRLRREYDCLPPGDIRKCLMALSDESTLLGDLLQYRFEDGGERRGASPPGGSASPESPDGAGTGGETTAGLAGHSFGNLFLTVLWRMTGDFREAVRQAGRILSIRGRVIPATLDIVSLVATYEDGSLMVGQRQISETGKRIRRVQLKPNPGPASAEVLEAIAGSDLIVVGPGSLYTSVLPNLLIDGVASAIRRSTATKVYVANIASVEGEVSGYSLRDHIEAFRQHVGHLPFDIVLVNSASPPRAVEKELAASGGKLVRLDRREFENDGYGLRFVEAELASHEKVEGHDPSRLSRALVTMLAEERERA